jgi:hypothetical protein
LNFQEAVPVAGSNGPKSREASTVATVLFVPFAALPIRNPL